MEATVESSQTQRPEASANVSVEQLKAMFRRKPAPAQEAAAGEGSSPVNGTARNEARKTSRTESKGLRTESGGKQSKATTTTAAPGGAAEAGPSPEGSEGVESGEGRVGSGEDGEGADGSRISTEGTETEGVATEGADTLPEGEESTEGNEGNEEEVADVPKAIREMRKRIDKLTRREKESKEEAAQLRELLAASAKEKEADGDGERRARSPDRIGTPYQGKVDPRFVNDPQLVSAVGRLEKASGIVAWAEDALEELTSRGEDTIAVGEQSFTRGQVRQILRNARADQAELTAQKATLASRAEAKWQGELEQHNRAAMAAYSWIGKQDAPEHKDARAILERMPELFQRADRMLLVADFIEGRKAREARAKKGGEGRGELGSGAATGQNGARGATRPTKPAPIPVSGSAGGVRVDGKAARVKEAEEALGKSGRAKDLVTLLRVKREAALANAD